MKFVRKGHRDDAAHTLVTGATGFIGNALAETLQLAGDKVVTLVRDDVGRDPGDAVVLGDVCNYRTCMRVLADYRVDTIYHLAAQSIVQTCSDDPVGALQVNVMGTANLLEAARVVGLHPRVVVMTSDKVYGAASPPYTEDTPLDAHNAYEVSKACQDLVARMYYHNYGLNVSVVRAVNVYGPGDPNDTRLIPRTIQRLLSGEAPVIHAGASEMRRSYLHVRDMVAALETICKKGEAGEAYCVGSPWSASVAEIITNICDLYGVTREALTGLRREGFNEIQDQSIDDSKLRDLGWEPKIPLAHGLANTIQWYRGL